MILSHHFVVHNGYDVKNLPLGPERIFFQLVMQGGGKVGVVIFFTISAWFFLDKGQTIKSNLKRIWILEREVLFWSLALMAFFLVFDCADFGMKTIVRSAAPTIMGYGGTLPHTPPSSPCCRSFPRGYAWLGERTHYALVIMVGFGMFLLFDWLSFRSRIINRIAQSAFAVYLVTDYPATRTLLWKHLLCWRTFISSLPPFCKSSASC